MPGPPNAAEANTQPISHSPPPSLRPPPHELPEEQIVKLLNAFFDLVVPGVVAGGGDVLKYIGDAVIAIFPVAGDDPAPACELALTAARTALAALQSAPPEI